MVKTCSKCKIEKPFDEFIKSKSTKDGLSYRCKSCDKEYRQKNKEYFKEYRNKNKERHKEYDKKYRQKNKKRIKEYSKEWRNKNKEHKKKRDKEYYNKNKEHIKASVKEYYNKNKKHINEYKKKWINEKKTDHLFRMKENLRSRTYKAFKNKGYRKNTKTQEMLGVDWQVAKKHIERQFTKGMNWNNYGEWHIDHIIPLASANTEERLKKLCHYSNLQPLWAEHNLSKSNLINGQQTLLRI